MLRTGPDPVMCIPAHQHPNNDLVDEHPMDEDEHLDFGDQGPLPSPTPLIVPNTVYDIMLCQHTWLLQHQPVLGLLLLLFCGLH
jgi:hypothetical protein